MRISSGNSVTIAEIDSAVKNLVKLPEFSTLFAEGLKLYDPSIAYAISLPVSRQQPYIDSIFASMQIPAFIDGISNDTAAFARYLKLDSYSKLSTIVSSNHNRDFY